MIFYVKLNEKLLAALEDGSYSKLAEEDDWPADLLKKTAAIFKQGKEYPVLAIDPVTVKSDRGLSRPTLYHVPLESGIISWVPSQLFRYAGLEPDAS